MPFEGKTIVERRQEFVLAAMQEGVNRAALYRHYGIDPKTGRKWIKRYRAAGPDGVADRSRCPHTSPTQTSPEVERQVLALRNQHPTWGGRKLAARLHALGQGVVPAPSTITAILHRHDRIDAATTRPQAYGRFERDAPNALW